MKTFFLTWKKKLIYFYFFHIFTVGEKGDLEKIILAKVFPTVFREHRRENSSDQNEKTDHQEKKTFFFSPQGFCKKVMR